MTVTGRGGPIYAVLSTDTKPTPIEPTALLVETDTGSFFVWDGTWNLIGPAGGGANTLDQAYDQGGAGAGRLITADSGAVVIDGNLDLASAGATGLLSIFVTGDAQPKSQLQDDRLVFGAGGALVPDTEIVRVANDLEFLITGITRVRGTALDMIDVGDANPDLRLFNAGIKFGPGGAGALDVDLSRAAANVLQLATGDTFRVETIDNVADLHGSAGADLSLTANQAVADATARQLILQTLDTTGNAFITVAQLVPTATETAPFLAMRADITTPLTGTLPASFLAFRWNPADDVVTVFVNDAGVLRSVAIGTVT